MEELTSYGWSETTGCTIVNNELVFTADEMLTNEKTYSKTSNNTVVEATFMHKGIDIGLVLWYNNTGYIKYLLSSSGLSIIRTYNDNEIILNTFLFSSSEDIAAPEIDSTVTLKAELYRTNIKCYLNDQQVFNMEQNTFKEGSFGLFGEADAICSGFIVKSNAFPGWIRHIEEGCGVIPSEDGIKFENTRTQFSYIEQSIDTEIGSTYTVSVKYVGNLYVEAHDGTSSIISDTATSASKDTFDMSFVATTVSTIIRIGTNLAGSTIIYTPQVEKKSFNTTYTLSREKSILSFPAAKVNRTIGGLSLWVSPLHTYTSGIMPIFYYNDSFNLVYAGGNFVLTYGSGVITMPYTLAEDTNYHIVVTWDNGNSISLNVYDEVSGDTLDSLAVTEQSVAFSSSIMIGSNPTVSANAVIDTLVVYSGEISVDQMKVYRVEPIEYSNTMAIKTDFSNNTLVFSQDRITVPNPKPGTPIIVEDEDGTVYDRVYFIDSGKYVTYNIEKFNYTGAKAFKVEYNNLMDVRANSNVKIYSDITVLGDTITVNDISEDDVVVDSEELTTTDNIIYKSVNTNWLRLPITIKRLVSDDIYEDVSKDQYIVDYTNGAIIFRTSVSYTIFASYTYSPTVEIFIQYTPKNVFCAGYNKLTGGYEILLSNVSGKAMTVTYENDYGADSKFVTTVEANPFKSANNNGFIYMTDTAIPVTSLDVKVTPDALTADGNLIATIIVDCLGEKGVPTSNASISISPTKYGSITKYISEQEQSTLDAYNAEKEANGEAAAIAMFGYLVTDENISGRYIYKYRVNNIATGETYTERIIVTDTKSGIGTEVPIRIVSKF